MRGLKDLDALDAHYKAQKAKQKSLKDGLNTGLSGNGLLRKTGKIDIQRLRREANTRAFPITTLSSKQRKTCGNGGSPLKRPTISVGIANKTYYSQTRMFRIFRPIRK